MAQERVLITGGAGFIGRALVARCLQEQASVTVYDNLCAGRLDNIAEFEDRIDFIRADILDSNSLNDAFARARPTHVFHLAAHHFIPFCNENPIETIRVNAEGSFRVLQAASRHDAQTCVVASSGVLYPNRDGLLEEDIDVEVIDVYGLSKQMTEDVCRYFANTTSMSCVSARLFNTYGPYETNPHLIPHIMESLHRGPRVELGNIYTKRDYIYVEDVAELLWSLSAIRDERYAVVNVGTGKEYSAEEIVRTISDLTGREIEINVDESRVRPVDKMHQMADTKALKRFAGMEARHSLVDGLTKLLAFEELHEALVLDE